ncbi:hypothetical protein LZD49_02175 [Dyadobacter sp. CY261]|uniref:hypothetical protein n=1 Tax=Dyadobacter sp. CY261 TaxID=2907203 RepID=UPI001F163B9A|nr:hypothetical protein [Dyadobacter sp. CY261]MCF0069260.1 hypothetical protein [Dyadobacter sp. CY261]
MNRRKIQRTLGITTLFVLSVMAACVEDGGLENIDQPCFTKESLETVPWIVDELKLHQDPMGHYVAVYIYDGQQFLGISHPTDCTPIGHVFNCMGVPFDSLGIDYRDFQDNRKLAAVLATLKY